MADPRTEVAWGGVERRFDRTLDPAADPDAAFDAAGQAVDRWSLPGTAAVSRRFRRGRGGPGAPARDRPLRAARSPAVTRGPQVDPWRRAVPAVAGDLGEVLRIVLHGRMPAIAAHRGPRHAPAIEARHDPTETSMPGPSRLNRARLDAPRARAALAARFPILILLSLAAAPAVAATFTVTTTADTGAGSLRQAILDANGQQSTQCTLQRIVFAIPGAGPHTIRPASPLPAVLIPTDIDGYSQPGASPNSLFNGSNAVLRIELDGSAAGATGGITLGVGAVGICGGGGSLLRGLAINRFAGPAITIGQAGCPAVPCAVGGVTIQGNFLGTDIGGALALGNGSATTPAILVGTRSVNNVIGEQALGAGGGTSPNPALRNVISGNGGDAVGFAPSVADFPSALTSVRGNYIGLDAAGTALLPNGGDGIAARDFTSDLSVTDNLIGGNAGDGFDASGPGIRASLARNGIGVGVGGVAAGNGGDGVRVAGGATVSVSGNYPGLFPPQPSIAHNGGAGAYVEGASFLDIIGAPLASNAGLGIDLAPRGINPNDPLDADTGPNHGLNAPLLDVVETDAAASTTRFSGRLQTEPNATIELNLYASPACDPAGAGEGLRRLSNNSGGVLLPQLTTNAAGEASFDFTTTIAQAQPLAVGQAVTAVARRFAPGQVSTIEVSEFSDCAIVRAAGVLFADGFEP